jgi:hypothetical protein
MTSESCVTRGIEEWGLPLAGTPCTPAANPDFKALSKPEIGLQRPDPEE